MERKSNVDSVTIVKVIKVESIFGKGVEEDPVHKMTEYYTLGGELIVRINSWTDERDLPNDEETTYFGKPLVGIPRNETTDAYSKLPMLTGLE